MAAPSYAGGFLLEGAASPDQQAGICRRAAKWEVPSTRQTIGPPLGGAFRIGQLTGFRGQNRTAAVMTVNAKSSVRRVTLVHSGFPRRDARQDHVGNGKRCILN